MTVYRISGSFARLKQCEESDDECCTNSPIDSVRIIYSGPNLPGTGVQTGDDLNVALQKMDDKILQLIQQIQDLTP